MEQVFFTSDINPSVKTETFCIRGGWSIVFIYFPAIAKQIASLNSNNYDDGNDDDGDGDDDDDDNDDDDGYRHYFFDKKKIALSFATFYRILDMYLAFARMCVSQQAHVVSDSLPCAFGGFCR